jgi:hypothetical protein
VIGLFVTYRAKKIFAHKLSTSWVMFIKNK